MWALLLFLFYGVIIGGSWYLTTKFKENFQQYNGTILWTLIFFPLLIAVCTGFGGISILMESKSFYSENLHSDQIILSLICIAISLGCGYLFVKEYKLLSNLNEENLDLIKKYITYILGIAMVGEIITNLFTSQYNETGATVLSIILITGILYLVWYYSKKKIDYFRRLLNGEEIIENQTYSFENIPDNSTPATLHEQKLESSKEKLYKLKDLLDKGILTQEEFDSMKKEILEKGI